MPDCSLCGGTIRPEGGAILFTDKWGVPFEVCDTCEEQADMLRNTEDEADVKRAFDYITGHAESIRDRNDYESVMGFLKESAPQLDIAGEMDVKDQNKELSPEAAKVEKKSRRRDLILLILLGILLALTCLFTGFKF